MEGEGEGIAKSSGPEAAEPTKPKTVEAEGMSSSPEIKEESICMGM